MGCQKFSPLIAIASLTGVDVRLVKNKKIPDREYGVESFFRGDALGDGKREEKESARIISEKEESDAVEHKIDFIKTRLLSYKEKSEAFFKDLKYLKDYRKARGLHQNIFEEETKP